jgi:hypothetical protein
MSSFHAGPQLLLHLITESYQGHFLLLVQYLLNNRPTDQPTNERISQQPNQPINALNHEISLFVAPNNEVIIDNVICVPSVSTTFFDIIS